MSGKWRYVKLADIAEKIAMGPFGSSIKVETFVETGIPIINGQHLHGIRLDETPGFNFITPEHADRLKNANVQKGDIIFTHRGDIGQVAYIQEDSQYDRYVISQSQFYMRCKRDYVIPEFIVYYFKTPEGRHKLLANASQVGVPSLAQPVSYLRNITVPLPPITEQRAIAHILGTLDDKIELNRRMNETLEAMARAIFKAWFVDFEPVRAKMDGRWKRGESLPGLPAHLYDLFPDRLVDSELGEIPEGWEVKPLPAVIDINPPRTLRKGQVAPYLDMGSMPTGSARALSVGYRGFGSGMRFTNGDTLVARITPCLEHGKTCFVDFLRPGEVGWGSTEYIVLRPKPPLPPEFAYFVARTETFRTFAISNMIGTSGRQRVSAGSLNGFLLAVPSESVTQKFGDIVRDIMSQMKVHDDESRTLVAMRDGQLPKLMSGAILVKDTKCFVGG